MKSAAINKFPCCHLNPSEWLMLSNYIYDSCAPRAACALHHGEERNSIWNGSSWHQKIRKRFHLAHMQSANFPPTEDVKLSLKFLQLKEMFLEAKKSLLALNLEEHLLGTFPFARRTEPDRLDVAVVTSNCCHSQLNTTNHRLIWIRAKDSLIDRNDV